jgi:hypothetical protein
MLLGTMCVLSGLIFLAMPVPLIVNNFTSFYAQAKAHERLKTDSNIQKKLSTKALLVSILQQNINSNSS